MKKHFITPFLLIFFFLIGFTILLGVVLPSIVRLEYLRYTPISTILLEFSLVFFICLLISLALAGFNWFVTRQTMRLVHEQLQALSARRSDQLKSPDQTYWYQTYLSFDFADFYQQTQSLDDQLRFLTQTLQTQTTSAAEGSQTREEIIQMERHRIARELHDSVSQQLFAAMMMLSAMAESKNPNPQASQQQIQLLSKVLGDAQSEMRALLLHLRPISLEGKTLKQGIEGLLKELQTKVNMTIRWQLDSVSLQSSVEDHLFRIVQELLSNTLRHSKASQLEVLMLKESNRVLVKVNDNGVGFDPDQIRPGSYGLTNIQERVEGFGGKMKLLSIPGKGTHVELSIPL